MTCPITVLVVEDEELIRMDIVDYLKTRALSSMKPRRRRGDHLLEAHPSIRVLFTDIDMPGSMDGLKLAAAVRDRWPPVKIVITLGHRVVEITDLPDGGVFFSKPYRHGEIATTFRKIMGG